MKGIFADFESWFTFHINFVNNIMTNFIFFPKIATAKQIKSSINSKGKITSQREQGLRQLKYCYEPKIYLYQLPVLKLQLLDFVLKSQKTN